MRLFPADFSELLNANGRRVFENAAGDALSSDPQPLTLLDGIMDAKAARDCARLLDEHLYPALRPMVKRIPRGSISGMVKNYSETLPKIASMKTCFLQSPRYRDYHKAANTGLIRMLNSPCLRRIAEFVTGLELKDGTHQAICYEHGDYAGPHNDHHPEQDRVKNGYVDLHIMFGNDAVAHHWLVYEHERHLNRIHDVNLKGGIAIYRLPFWHYTTPLMGKPGREAEARRWLLLASYEIASHAPRRPRAGQNGNAYSKRVPRNGM